MSTVHADNQGDYSSSQSDSEDSPRRSNRKLIMNIAQTQYPLIRSIAKNLLEMKVSRKSNDNWDVLWTDCGVEPEVLSRMKPYQKINHFPGMYMISRKNFLAKNLNKLQKFHPEDYRFYPKTWVLPAELSDLKISQKRNSVYIVKPEASSQGSGIFLTKNLDDLSINDRLVVQEYIKRPFLIDGLKFDMRIYVLLAGCNPLRIFIHKEGLVRLATQKYSEPNAGNLNKQYMHLTNYAINKKNKKFVFNRNAEADNVGHKRSLSSTLEELEEGGHDVATLWNEIKDIVSKTLCSIQPSLAHTYKACQPSDPFNGMCFEILGFDILLDKKLRPWLLEVNHSPSFTADCPIDERIKTVVIEDSLRLLNISEKNKKDFFKLRKHEISLKALYRAKEREIRVRNYEYAQKKRDDWENNNMGRFQKVTVNDEFVATANKIWEEWTGVSPKPVKEKILPAVVKARSFSYNSEVYERLSKPMPKKHVTQATPAHIRLDESRYFCPSMSGPPLKDTSFEDQIFDNIKRSLISSGQSFYIHSVAPRQTTVVHHKSLFPKLEMASPAGFRRKRARTRNYK